MLGEGEAASVERNVDTSRRLHAEAARDVLCAKLGLVTRPALGWFLERADAVAQWADVVRVIPSETRLLGFTERHDGSVYIRANLSGEELVETIAHELAHVAEPQRSHEQIRQMATFLAQRCADDIGRELARRERACSGVPKPANPGRFW